MSAIGLEPTTVENAGVIMSRTLGLQWPRDRSEILEYINDFRDILYNSYNDLKLFDNVFHCIRISSFPDVCGSPCDRSPCHQGFVLPDDVVSVSAAWDYGYPLKIHSRWRESHFGLDNESAPRVSITETPEQVCTERALLKSVGLKMFCEAEEDNGKKARIEARMNDDQVRTLCFTLKADSWVVVDRAVLEILSISLPAGRKGNLILAQMDGYELSLYRPYETVPLYRKFRVANQCKAGTVLIQGVKRFVPVSCDHDIVEIGSRTILQAAGSFLKFESNTTETKDLKRAGYDLTKMGRFLSGLQARHRGNAIQDNSPSVNFPARTSRILPGYHAR